MMEEATMDSFQTELQSFVVQLPGGQNISFCDDAAMEEQMEQHYGKWKVKAGMVTSIPLVRIPRVFLDDTLMPAFLRKQMEANQKGEQGEMKIFKCALGLKLGVGLAIFPNVDSHCFKELDSHVEIDMILVHPRKGIFVFNVKNAKTKVPSAKFADDVKKHARFLRRLCSQSKTLELPVNTIVCSLKRNLNSDFQKNVKGQIDDPSLRDSLFFLNSSDVDNFSVNFQTILTNISDLSDDERKLADVLTLRLFGINVMTGSLFHIHQQFVDGGFQETRKYKAEASGINRNFARTVTEEAFLGEITEDQFTADLEKLSMEGEPSSADQATENLENLSLEAESPIRVILWTEEQIKLIYTLMNQLRQQQGCRIIVEGCKGSGKTLIMMQIAFLAKHLPGLAKIVIADGRLGDSIVFVDELKKLWKDDKQVSVSSGEELTQKISGCQLLMFDECNDPSVALSRLERYASKNTHLILFASRSINVDGKKFKTLKLTNALRMTREVAEFAEKFREENPDCHELPIKAEHNVSGMRPVIEVVEPEDGDLEHQCFVNAAVKSIEDALNNCRGLRNILVAPFVHAVTLQRILDALQYKGMITVFRNPEEKRSNYQHFPSRHDALKTSVIVGTGHHIDGSEYAAVIALLDASLPIWWSDTLHDGLFIALTRATISVRLIFNVKDQAPTSYMRKVYEECILSDQGDLTDLIEQKAIEMNDTEGPIYLAGDIPNSFKEIECPREFSNFPFKWYLAKTNENYIVVNNSLVFSNQNDLIPSVIIVACQNCHTPINPHRWLYFTVDNARMAHVPMNWVTWKESTRSNSGQKIPQKIRQFCRANVNWHNSSTTDFARLKESLDQSWETVKECGNEMFKQQNFVEAADKYMKAAELLTRKYKSSLSEEPWCLKDSCEMRGNLAKIFSNLSTTFMKKSEIESKETSLDYAKKTILADPTWKWGWKCAEERWSQLEMDPAVEESKFKKTNGIVHGKLDMKLKILIIQDKLKQSKIWDMLRFKDSIYLIGAQGDNHFPSIMNALKSLSKKSFNRNGKWKFTINDVSLVLRPGTYEVLEEVELFESSIDIVGDWNPSHYDVNGAITQESSVLLKHGIGQMFTLTNCDGVRIARISLGDEKINNRAVDLMILVTDSTFEVLECYVKRDLSGLSESDITVSRCRFYGGAIHSAGIAHEISFSRISGKSQLNVSNSTFIGGKLHVAILIAKEAAAGINQCRFHDRGIFAIAASEVNVLKCHFDKCGFVDTMQFSGAMQLQGSPFVVQNTRIHNSYNGLIVKGGGGILKGLEISNCESSGIFANPDSTLEIRECKMTRVRYGIVVDERAGKKIVMENNDISNCTHQIYGYGRKAQKPIMKGTSQLEFVCGKNDIEELPTESRTEESERESRYFRAAARHHFDRSFMSFCSSCETILSGKSEFWKDRKEGIRRRFCSAKCREEDRLYRWMMEDDST